MRDQPLTTMACGAARAKPVAAAEPGAMVV
jgi:hypothetical protein